MRAVPLPFITIVMQVAGRRWKVIKKAYDLAKTNKFYLSKIILVKKLAR